MFAPETLTRKGLCPVTKARGQEGVLESHSIYFELHGRGPERVLFIMGMNSRFVIVHSGTPCVPLMTLISVARLPGFLKLV